MSDHTINAMHAAARSMREVVLPAIDPAHPLAAEQAGLIVKYLDLWAGRLDFLGARNAAELRCYLRMGQAVKEYAEQVSGEISRCLEEELARAQRLAADSDHNVPAIQLVVRELTRTITALVRAAAEMDHPSAPDLERSVIEHTRDVALLQRAWFAPQGWEEPAPPPLDDVLNQILSEGTQQ